MRVLWLVNNQMPAVGRRIGAGPIASLPWQSSLIDILSTASDHQFAVGCMSHEQFEPFDEHGVRYFSLNGGLPPSRSARVAGRWRSRLYPQPPLETAGRICAEFQPDVIHVHGTEHGLGLIADLTKVPVVVSIQGILTVYNYLERRGIDAGLILSTSPGLLVRGEGLWAGRLAYRTAAPLERRVFATCRHFIGRTRFDQDVTRVLSPRSAYYHCDEVLRAPFYQATWSAAQASPLRIYATTGAYARKDVRTLLEATALLRDSGHPQAHLLIAGRFGGVEGDRAVRRLISRLRLAPTVKLLGSLDADSIVRELQAASVFVHPSHADNSPNSLAEALLVGTPCVASAVGGVPTLAPDGEQALLVQDGDPYSLAGALCRMFDDPALAARLSAAARAAALRRHDRDTISATQLAIYQKVADSR